MKHTSKQNAGFTLIELVVAMAMAVIVTAAATSVLLMGLRVNRQTGDTATQQMTVRSVIILRQTFIPLEMM
jgi:prepilin-type N-terminal cleavage/methylation domain-containing protein